ncbi:dATP pyrophosphohydrolase [Acidocella sp.]|uniref:dATP pyrophosphohydrolase n=1 Tax=Acidocella sp. TaxID=50710 RepID=UPI003D0866A1
MSNIQIVPVTDKKLLKRFILLPERLHKDDPAYIAPLHMEREEALGPKNPLFGHAQAQFWLAVRDGRDVGRISAQIDTLAQSLRPDEPGMFGMLAAENDPDIFLLLLETAANWLRARGMKRVLGPFNLNINEETGALIDGFGTPPMLLMPHDLPYVAQQLEALGMRKAKDVIAYLYDMRVELPDSVRRLLARPLPPGLTVRRLDMKRIKEEIKNVTSIFNDAWSRNWGFVPLTEAETDYLAKSLKPLLDPRMTSLVERDGEPVAFMIALPNLNEAIEGLDGKILPFGWAKLLWRLKVSGVKTARVPLMGVRRSAAKDMIGSLMPYLMIDMVRREGVKMGYTHIELSWILEDNMPMRRMIESLDAKPYKTYRVFEADL